MRRGQPAVFVTLEEPADDLRSNLSTLGWDIAGWEERGDWRFVDASPVVREDGSPVPYSFTLLAAQIGLAVDETGADRIVLDSLNSVFALSEDPGAARQRLRQLVSRLRASGLTVLMTVETASDPAGSLSRYGIEEFVADNVVLLRNTREGKGRRRTLEVLKMRGAMHHRGDYAFTVLPGEGIVVLPVATTTMSRGRPAQRVPSGVADLDLYGGGLLRDSTVLVVGPTGTGKTLLGLEFLAGAAARRREVSAVCCWATRSHPSRSGATPWAAAGPLTGYARTAACGSCRSTRRRPRSRTTCSRSNSSSTPTSRRG